MTTFQDQQPQSRRSVRERERVESALPQPPFTQEPPAAPQQYTQISPTSATDSSQPQPAPMSRRDAVAASSGVAPAVGRRSAANPTPPVHAQSPAVALALQAAAPAPAQQSHTPRAAAPQVVAPVQHTHTPQAEAPQAAAPAHHHVAPWSTPVAAPIVQVPRFPPPASFAPPSPPYASTIPATGEPRQIVQAEEAAPEHTLTRRELRALQHAEEQATTFATSHGGPGPRALQLPPPEHAEHVSMTAHVAGPPAVVAEFIVAEAETLTPTPHPSPAVASASSTGSLHAERATSDHARDTFPAGLALVPSSAPAAPHEGEPPSRRAGRRGAVVAAVADPTGPSASVTHWSTQPAEREDLEGVEKTISRTIGSGSTATSALVLPGAPPGADIRGPLTGNGEILLTGSIDLPHTLSSAGTSDRFDSQGMDALFDLNDAELISTDSAPVRAIRAISSNTSGHGVTHTVKPRGTRGLTALLIAASVLAVVVAGLLVVTFAFKLF